MYDRVMVGQIKEAVSMDSDCRDGKLVAAPSVLKSTLQTFIIMVLLLLIAFIQRYSPLSGSLTALACDFI